MAYKKKSFKIGNNKSIQKSISITLESNLKRFQKYLQTKENVKHGRKAANISFLFASSKSKDFARFMLRGDNK
jgi:hypothetical protein